MMDLIAQGESPQERWRQPIPTTKFTLGREAVGWAVPWDDLVSRKHVEIERQGNAISVRRLKDARNPVFVDGKEVDQTLIPAGEHFVIGRTRFTVMDEQVMVTMDARAPMNEKRFSRQYLQDVRYRDADKRIDVLSRLPELIQGSATDQQLYSRFVNVLLTGISRCDSAAIVDASNDDTPSILHWDATVRASRTDFQPSQRLIQLAVQNGESVIHRWSSHEQSAAFTQREDTDWAFCVPIAGSACQGWALYVAGSSGVQSEMTMGDFQDDMKFAQSAAAMLGNLRDVQKLERGNAALGQFFSPVVMDMLAVADPDVVLSPTETEISVMFCDLRGFSRHSEASADDLFGLLDRVSQALGVVTHQILESSGVVGDFQGDSVMGFWGWPLEQSDAALRACMTAIHIRREIAAAHHDTKHPLSQFNLGIGIATGRAVAGKIGTVDQFKVTVFGPVVNLASRLEGMTKRIAPILIDAPTAKIARKELSSEAGRIRNIATIQPFGMTRTAEICELMLPESESPKVNADQLEATNLAAAAFQAGDWQSVHEHLGGLDAEDSVRLFLLDSMNCLNGQPPESWEGIVRMMEK